MLKPALAENGHKNTTENDDKASPNNQDVNTEMVQEGEDKLKVVGQADDVELNDGQSSDKKNCNDDP